MTYCNKKPLVRKIKCRIIQKVRTLEAQGDTYHAVVTYMVMTLCLFNI